MVVAAPAEGVFDLLFREGARGFASALTEFLLRWVQPRPSGPPAPLCADCVCRCECLDLQVHIIVVISGSALIFFVLGFF